MLSLIEKKKELDQTVLDQLKEKLADQDGFIVISMKESKFQWNRYQLSDIETLWLLEWAKSILISEMGN